MNIKDTDWAWLAGFIDGDGCFTSSVWEKVTNGIPSITIAPRLIIAQAKQGISILDYVVDLIKVGKVYIKKEKSNLLNSQDQGMYTVSRLEDIKYICYNILPHIVLKKRQCESMIELIELRLQGKIGINKWSRERIPIENTLKAAELSLSLNPNATTGRNSRHNSEKRTCGYWKERIPEVYSIASKIIKERKANRNIELICEVCDNEFTRYKSNVREYTKHNYCSKKCADMGKSIFK